jgi:hypothetical protein
MKRDPRYSDIKVLYEGGRIKYFTDIFRQVSKTSVARNLGIRVDRFNKYLEDVGTFVTGDLVRLASLCGLEFDAIMDIWKREYAKQREERLKK